MKPPANSVDTSVVRRMNTRTVLLALRSYPGATLTQLAGSTGLSRQTTTAALAALLDRGLCVELAPARGSSGRPARRYRFRSGAAHVVGLSIAPGHVRVMVADLDGTIVAQQRIAVSPTMPAEERLVAAERLATGMAAEAGEIWAAAVGTSGVIDPDGRVRVSSQIPGWTGLDLASRVGGWFGCAGFAGNDASHAAVAELWCGNAQYVRDVVYLLTGYRSGYGMVVNGQVHRGHSGAAGEFGRLPYLRGHDTTLVLERHGMTADEVFARAEAEDPDALEVVEELASVMTRSAAVMTMAIDPELVVVGGELAPGGHVLVEPLRRRLGELCHNPPAVALSALGEEAVALGSVRVALDHVEADPRMLGSSGASVTGLRPV